MDGQETAENRLGGRIEGHFGADAPNQARASVLEKSHHPGRWPLDGKVAFGGRMTLLRVRYVVSLGTFHRF